MKLEDARSLSQDSQESLRKRAVKAVIEQKKTHHEVAGLLGVARGTVSRWVSVCKKMGLEALALKKRGRRALDMYLLKPHQCGVIVRMVSSKCPNQLKLPFMLWTREAVGQLIEQKFGIKLSIRSVGNYLKKWGFTPQKPIKKAYEQSPKAVALWLQEEYPEIKTRAQAENAEIHWGDEAGFRSDHQTGTSYSRKGIKPIIPGTGKRFSTNMISSITNKGTLRFMLYEDRFSQAIFIKFLKRLIKSICSKASSQSSKAPTKVFLIVDNHSVHHGKEVHAFIQKHQDKIELFFLPTYAPELNPDELLNQDVKSNAVGRKRARSLKEMRNNLTRYLFAIQNCRKSVMAYFHKTEVSCAA